MNAAYRLVVAHSCAEGVRSQSWLPRLRIAEYQFDCSIILQTLYEVWRGEWSYLIPDQPDARQQLRTFCAALLEWERSFLQHYRLFVLQELATGLPAMQEDALRVQQHWPLQDPDILRIVRQRSSNR